MGLLRAPFFILGVPPDDAPNAPFTQWNTEKIPRFFVWCAVECRFDVASDANNFWKSMVVGDRFSSSAGAGGNWARPMRLPDPSPVLDVICAPMGPEILSSAGAGVGRKAPMAFPDSSSVLDKSQSAMVVACVLGRPWSRRADGRSLPYLPKSTSNDFRGACEKALLEGLLTVYPTCTVC